MTKDDVRHKVWTEMEKLQVSRFPGATGRIPNFTGAEKCARLLDEIPEWKRAKTIKANPDSPQRMIRWKALKQGKIVYMAVPRLAGDKPFLELDPARLGKNAYRASSIRGAFEFGRAVDVEEMKKIDMVVCGSVAVSRTGLRVGKGGGYSELEYALAREAGKIHQRTTILTSVHPIQVMALPLRFEVHDFPVDIVLTPEEILRCKVNKSRPKGIYWDRLPQEKIEAIPVLQRLKKRRRAKRQSAS